jgi:hypothetical protein
MRERRRANEEIWHKGLEAVEIVSWEHYEEHSWWKMRDKLGFGLEA